MEAANAPEALHEVVVVVRSNGCSCPCRAYFSAYIIIISHLASCCAQPGA